MLKHLRINNIALIRSLEIEWSSGLVLLTGETGAGKSIVIDALGLVLGDRASPDMIRTGEDKASVEAIFEAPRFESLLEARGLPTDDGQMIIRREIQTSGKGRASINGALVPVSVLRELAGSVASIHGQHEPQGLLDPDSHLLLVDRFGGLEGPAQRVSEAFRSWRVVEGELESLREGRRDAERRRESLSFQLAEIEKAELSAGEEEALRRERLVQAHADRLDALCGDAYGTLYEDEAAVLSRLSHVFRCVGDMAAIDPMVVEQYDRREEVLAVLEDLALFLRDYRGGLAVTPGRLDEIESRLALIERLKKKYGATVGEVLAFADRCRGELQSLADPEGREKELEQRRDDWASRFVEQALALSVQRRVSAREMEERVCRELTQLAMEKARFEVRFSPAAAPDPSGGASELWSGRGLETAEFYLSPNPGEELRPLGSHCLRGGAFSNPPRSQIGRDIGRGGKDPRLRRSGRRHRGWCGRGGGPQAQGDGRSQSGTLCDPSSPDRWPGGPAPRHPQSPEGRSYDHGGPDCRRRRPCERVGPNARGRNHHRGGQESRAGDDAERRPRATSVALSLRNQPWPSRAAIPTKPRSLR